MTSLDVADDSANVLRTPPSKSGSSLEVPEEIRLRAEPENVASMTVPASSRTTPTAQRVRSSASSSSGLHSKVGGVTSTPKDAKRATSVSTVGATPFCNAAPIPPSIVAPSAAAASSFFDNLKLELDAASMILFITALSTRFYKLDEPRAVVFDELNFGRFASNYLKRVFYFDVHPPLGKMLIAAAASYGLSSYHHHGTDGVDGGGGAGSGSADGGFEFSFETIGAEIPSSVPLWHLRFVPALCGSLLAPLSYHLLLEIGCSSWTASLGAVLVILDNALLVQSHFILLEPILLCAVALSFISLLKFLKSPKSLSSPLSIFWLISLGVFLGAAISVKYSAVYAWFMSAVAVCVHFWRRQLPDVSVSWRVLVFRALLCCGAVVAFPVVIYGSIFGAHVLWLHRAGPHDHVMTSAFQASLDGGLASIIKGQPPFIKYGSQITLRHTFGQPPCWLHSHQEVYPLKYPDDRGSSHQQQVTCYAFKDVNNWWIVKDPNSDTIPDDPSKARTIKHGDVIQLLHGVTGRALNSHDVAAPLTPENQEVSCYIDYNVSMPAQNLWRVEIVGGAGGESNVDLRWRTILSHVRLVHVDTKQALKSTQKSLPDWAFNQIEVATERVMGIEQKMTLWNVEEHRAPKKLDDLEAAKTGTDDAGAGTTLEEKGAALEPEETISQEDLEEEAALYEEVMTLREKMVELQWKMITTIHDIPQEHRYGSTPDEWPFLDTTVGYWISSESHSQIHLLGNPIIWKTGVFAAALYLALLAIYLVFFHRGWMTHPDHAFQHHLPHISILRDSAEDDGEEEEEEEEEEEDFDGDNKADVSPPLDITLTLPSSDWWGTFQRGGWLLVGGYLLHFIPYFVYDHTLFLHHYIPALYFKILLLAFVVDHVGGGFLCGRARILQHALTSMVVAWLVVVLLTFKTLAPLSYGDANLTAEQLKGLQLNDNWDFVFH